MKVFDLTTYKFYRPAHAGLKIAIISDLHFSHQVKDQKLAALTKFLKKLRPSYIFLPGDLIDYADMVDDVREAERLLRHLENIAKIAPLLISYGNHDFYRRTAGGWQEDRSESFFADVATLKNVHLLDDRAFTDQNIYALGINLGFNYYGNGNLTHPGAEDKTLLLNKLKKMDSQLTHNLPAKKLKFTLIHSPVHLHDRAITKELAEFDYFISGHMHNGVVPPVLDSLWLSSKGIISPTKNFFPPDVRRTIKTNDDKSIVVGAVTTFHHITGPLHLANALYPTYVTLLEFTKDKKYAQKPYVGRKYYSWD
ncbi:metallophosphoesterase [Candidatus Saccharibacteria bacterium]|nr:metallophosphoesterase [Candidatus Saccharibacteria bacterium]